MADEPRRIENLGSLSLVASVVGGAVAALVSAGFWFGMNHSTIDAMRQKDAEFDEWRKGHELADRAHNDVLSQQLRDDEMKLNTLIGEVREFHEEYRSDQARRLK